MNRFSSNELSASVVTNLILAALFCSHTPPARRLIAFFLFCTLVTVSPQELFEGAETAPPELDRTYVKGLNYLASTQLSNGAWPDANYGSEPAVVGLAVVSMLAHGEDPNHGPYSQPVRRGLNFVLSQMDTKTGYIGRSMYNHGFATLALAEAYGAVEDPRLGPALQKAVNLILSAQARNPLGAWRYSPESTDADTTVSGAQMVALFAARNAGIAVPEEAIQKGIQFFHGCQTADGGYGYTPGSAPNATRTAIGCLVLALAKDKNSKAFKLAFNYLQKARAESVGSFQNYHLYYASQAFFHASPEAWRDWNRRNIQTLANSQTEEGSWSDQFGSTFGTAASLLSLALNYRYLPIYER